MGLRDNERDKSNRAYVKSLLPLIAPWIAKKTFGFTKKDNEEIRVGFSKSMALVAFIGSIIALILGIFFLVLTYSSLWGFSKPNDFMRGAGFSLVSLNIAALVFLSIDFFGRGERPVLRIGGDLIFHISLVVAFCLFFLADLTNGDLSQTESITSAVGLFFMLAICQPGLLIEAILIDAGAGIATIGICIYGVNKYNMRCIDQYMIFVFVFWVGSYILFSAYSYVEAQRHYIESRNADLYSRSTHDALTGARNRAGLRFYLDERLHNWVAKRENILLIMFDIDDFKLYNDTFGHLEGDEVLTSIVKAIESNPEVHHLRLFRYGGEEFLVIRSRTDEEEAKSILETLRKTVENLHFPAPLESQNPFLTISLGGSLWTVGQDYVFHDQLDDADKALYEAKRAGKNGFVLHTKLEKVEIEKPASVSLLPEETQVEKQK